MGLLKRTDLGTAEGTVASPRCWDWVLGFTLEANTLSDTATELVAGALIPAQAPAASASDETLGFSPMLVMAAYVPGANGNTVIAPPTHVYGDSVVLGQFTPQPSNGPHLAIRAVVVYNSGDGDLGPVLDDDDRVLRWSVQGAGFNPPDSQAVPQAVMSASTARSSSGTEPLLFAVVNCGPRTGDLSPRDVVIRGSRTGHYAYLGPFQANRGAMTAIAALPRTGATRWVAMIEMGPGSALGARSVLATRDHVYVAGLVSQGAGITYRRTNLIANSVTGAMIPAQGSADRRDFGTAGSGLEPRPFLFRYRVLDGRPDAMCAAWVGAPAQSAGDAGILLDSATLLRVNFSSTSLGPGPSQTWGRGASPPAITYDGLWGVMVFCGQIRDASNQAVPLSLGVADPAAAAHPGLPAGARSAALCMAVEEGDDGYGSGRVLWAHTLGSRTATEERTLGVVGGHLASGFSESGQWAGAMNLAALRRAVPGAATGDDHVWAAATLAVRSSPQCRVDDSAIVPGLCDVPASSSRAQFSPVLWHLDPATGATLATELLGEPLTRHVSSDVTLKLRAAALLPPVRGAAGQFASSGPLATSGARGVGLLLVGHVPAAELAPESRRRRGRSLLSSGDRTLWGMDGDTWTAPSKLLGSIPDTALTGGSGSHLGYMIAVAPRPAPSVSLAAVPQALSPQGGAVTLRLALDGTTAALALTGGVASSGAPPGHIAAPPLTAGGAATVIILRDVTAAMPALVAAGSRALPTAGAALAESPAAGAPLFVAASGNGTASAAALQGRLVPPPAGGFGAATLTVPPAPPTSDVVWVLAAVRDVWGVGSAVVFPLVPITPGGVSPTAGFAAPSTATSHVTRSPSAVVFALACDPSGLSSGSDAAQSLEALRGSDPTYDLPAAQSGAAAAVARVEWRVDGGAWTATGEAATATVDSSCVRYGCDDTLSAGTGVPNACAQCLETVSGHDRPPSSEFRPGLALPPGVTWRQWSVQGRCCDGAGRCSVPAEMSLVADTVPPRAVLAAAPPADDRSSTARFRLECSKTDASGAGREVSGRCSYQYRVYDGSTPPGGAFLPVSASAASANQSVTSLPDDLAVVGCLASRVDVVVDADGGPMPLQPERRRFRVVDGRGWGTSVLSATASPGGAVTDGVTPVVNTTRVGFRVVTAVPAAAFALRLSVDLRAATGLGVVSGAVRSDGSSSLQPSGGFVAVPLGTASAEGWSPVFTPSLGGPAPSSSLTSAVVWLDHALSALLAASDSHLSAVVHAEAVATLVDPWTGEAGLIEPVASGAAVVVDTLAPTLTVTSLPPSSWAYDPVGSLAALPVASAGYGTGQAAPPLSDSDAGANQEAAAWWGGGAAAVTVACSAAERADWGNAGREAFPRGSAGSADPAGQPCLVRYSVNGGPTRLAVGGVLPIPAADVTDGTNTLSARATDAAGNAGPAVTATWTHSTAAAAAALAARPTEPRLLQLPPAVVVSAHGCVAAARPGAPAAAPGAPGLDLAAAAAAGLAVETALVGPAGGSPGGTGSSARLSPLPPTRGWSQLGPSGRWSAPPGLGPGGYRLWMRTSHPGSGVTSQASASSAVGAVFAEFSVLQPQRFAVPALPGVSRAGLVAGALGGSTLDALAMTLPGDAASAFVPSGAVAVMPALPCARLATTTPSSSSPDFRDLHLVLAPCDTPVSAVVTRTALPGTSTVTSTAERPAAPDDAAFPHCSLEVEVVTRSDPALAGARGVDWGGIELLVSKSSSSTLPGLEGLTVETGVAPGAAGGPTTVFDSDAAWPASGTAPTGAAGAVAGSVGAVPGAPGSWGLSLTRGLLLSGSVAPKCTPAHQCPSPDLSEAAAVRLVAGDDNSTALGAALAVGHTYRQGIRVSVRRFHRATSTRDVVLLLRARRPSGAARPADPFIHSDLTGVGLRWNSGRELEIVQLLPGGAVSPLSAELSCAYSSLSIYDVSITMVGDQITATCRQSSFGSGASSVSVRTSAGLGFRPTCGRSGADVAFGSAARPIRVGPTVRLSALPLTSASRSHTVVARPVCRGVRGAAVSVSLALAGEASASQDTLTVRPRAEQGPLGEGVWEVQVLAADALGNAQVVPNATTHRWRIDTTSPVSSVTVLPPPQAVTAAAGAGGPTVDGVTALALPAPQDLAAALLRASKARAEGRAAASDVTGTMLRDVAAALAEAASTALSKDVGRASRTATRGVAGGSSPSAVLTRAVDAPAVRVAVSVLENSTVTVNASAAFVPGAVLSPEAAAAAAAALPSALFVRFAGATVAPGVGPDGRGVASASFCLPRLPADTLTPGWPASASVGAGAALAMPPSSSCPLSPELSPLAIVSREALTLAVGGGSAGAFLRVGSAEEQAAAWSDGGGGPGSAVATAQGTLLVRVTSSDAAGNTEAGAAGAATLAVSLDRTPPVVSTLYPATATRGEGRPAVLMVDIVASEPGCVAVMTAIDGRDGRAIGQPMLVVAGDGNSTDASAADGPRRWRLPLDITPLADAVDAAAAAGAGGPERQAFAIETVGVDAAGNVGPVGRSIGWVDRQAPTLTCGAAPAEALGRLSGTVEAVLSAAGLPAGAEVSVVGRGTATFACAASEPLARIEIRVRSGYAAPGGGAVPPASSPGVLFDRGAPLPVGVSAASLGTPTGVEFASATVESDTAALRATIASLDPTTNPPQPEQPFTLHLAGLRETPSTSIGRGKDAGTVLVVELRATDAAMNEGGWTPLGLAADLGATPLGIKGTNAGLSGQCMPPWTARYPHETLLGASDAASLALPDLSGPGPGDARCSQSLPFFLGLPRAPADHAARFGAARFAAAASFEVRTEAQSLARGAAVRLPLDALVLDLASSPSTPAPQGPGTAPADRLGDLLAAAGDPSKWLASGSADGLDDVAASSPLLRAAQTAAGAAALALIGAERQALAASPRDAAYQFGPATWSADLPAAPRVVPAPAARSVAALTSPVIAWPLPNETATRAASPASATVAPWGLPGLAIDVTGVVSQLRNGHLTVEDGVLGLTLRQVADGGPPTSAGEGAASPGVLAVAVTTYDAGGHAAPRVVAVPFVVDRTAPVARIACRAPAELCAAMASAQGSATGVWAAPASGNDDDSLWTSGDWAAVDAEAVQGIADPSAYPGAAVTAAGRAATAPPFGPGDPAAPAVVGPGLLDLVAACGDDPVAAAAAAAPGARWGAGGYLDDRCVFDVMVAYQRHQQTTTPPPVRVATVRGAPPGSLFNWTSGLGAAATALGRAYAFDGDTWRSAASAASLASPSLPQRQADAAAPADGLYAARVRAIDAAGNPGAWTPWLRWAVDGVAPNASVFPLAPPASASSDDLMPLTRAEQGDDNTALLGSSARRGARARALPASATAGGIQFLVVCGEAALGSDGALSPLLAADPTDLGGGCSVDIVHARSEFAGGACAPASTGGASGGSVAEGSVVSDAVSLAAEEPPEAAYMTLRRGGVTGRYGLAEATPADVAASRAADAAAGFSADFRASGEQAFGAWLGPAAARSLPAPASVLGTAGLRYFRLSLLPGLVGGAGDTMAESLWVRPRDAAGNAGAPSRLVFRRDASAPPLPDARSVPPNATSGLEAYRYELYSALTVLSDDGLSIAPSWRRDDAAADGALLYALSPALEARVTVFQGASAQQAAQPGAALRRGQFRADPAACAELEAAVRVRDASSFLPGGAAPWEGVFFRFQATLEGGGVRYALNAPPDAASDPDGEYWSCATGPMELKGVPEGTLSVRVKAVDAAGQEGPSRTFSTLISSSLPRSAVVASPPARTSLRRVAIAVAVTAGTAPALGATVTFTHRKPQGAGVTVFDVPVHALSPGPAPGVAGHVAVLSLPNLIPGDHSVSVASAVSAALTESASTLPPAVTFTVVDCPATAYERLGPNGTLDCVTCPLGANCDHPRTSLATMPAAVGWWSSGRVFPGGARRRFYRCATDESCPGGNPVPIRHPAVPPLALLPPSSVIRSLYDAYLPPASLERRLALEASALEAAATAQPLGAYPPGAAANATLAASALLGEVSRCAEGHSGLLCSQCLDGFFLSFQRCQPCPAERSQAFVLTAAILVGLLLLGLVFLRLRRFLPLVQVKVMLAFAQILAATVTAYDIPWPVLFADTVNSLRIFVLDVVQATRLQCAQPVSYLESFHVQVTLPLALGALLAVVGIAARCRARQRSAACAARLGCGGLATMLRPASRVAGALSLWEVSLGQGDDDEDEADAGGAVSVGKGRGKGRGMPGPAGGGSQAALLDNPMLRGGSGGKRSGGATARRPGTALLSSQTAGMLTRRRAGGGGGDPLGAASAVSRFRAEAGKAEARAAVEAVGREVSSRAGGSPAGSGGGGAVLHREAATGETCGARCLDLAEACCGVGAGGRIASRLTGQERAQLALSIVFCCGLCCRPSALRHGGKTGKKSAARKPAGRLLACCACPEARSAAWEAVVVAWATADAAMEPVRDLAAFATVPCAPCFLRCARTGKASTAAAAVQSGSGKASPAGARLSAAAKMVSALRKAERAGTPATAGAQSERRLSAVIADAELDGGGHGRGLPLCAACCLGARQSAEHAGEPGDTLLGTMAGRAAGCVSVSCVPCETAVRRRTAGRSAALRARRSALHRVARDAAGRRRELERRYFALPPRQRLEEDANVVRSAAVTRVLLLIAMVVFAPVSLACLRMLRCVDVDGSRVLLADLRQSCSGVVFRSHEAYAVAVLLGFTAGFPVLLVLYIRRNLAALRAASEEQETAREDAEAEAASPTSARAARLSRSSRDLRSALKAASGRAAGGGGVGGAEPAAPSTPPRTRKGWSAVRAAASTDGQGSGRSLLLAAGPARPASARGQREGVLDAMQGASRAKMTALLGAAREAERQRSLRTATETRLRLRDARRRSRRWEKRWSHEREDWYFENRETGETSRERPADFDGSAEDDDAGQAAAGESAAADAPAPPGGRAGRLRDLASLVYAPSGTLPAGARRGLFAVRQRHAVMLRVGAMYDGYTPRAYWWEAEELLRRLALSALIVLVPSGSSLQVATATLVAAAALALLNLVEPYQDPSAQRLQQLAFATTLFVFWTGMLLKTDAAAAAERSAAGGASDVDERTDRVVMEWLGVAMVALTVTTVVVGVGLFVRDTARNMLTASLKAAKSRRSRSGRGGGKAGAGKGSTTTRPSIMPPKKAGTVTDTKDVPNNPQAAGGAGTAGAGAAPGKKAADTASTSQGASAPAATEEAPEGAALVSSLQKVRFGLRATKNPASGSRRLPPPGAPERKVLAPVRSRMGISTKTGAAGQD